MPAADRAVNCHIELTAHLEPGKDTILGCLPQTLCLPLRIECPECLYVLDAGQMKTGNFRIYEPHTISVGDLYAILVRLGGTEARDITVRIECYGLDHRGQPFSGTTSAAVARGGVGCRPLSP